MGDQTMTPDERAAVAREVLTEFADECEAQGRLGMADEARAYRDLTHPAPAAPVTVTVETSYGRPVTLTRNAEGGWNIGSGAEAFVSRSLNANMASRIAADAQRIEELERENARLREEVSA